MSWVPKAIIIISADGQNQRVICNIMNAPIQISPGLSIFFLTEALPVENCIYIICSERFLVKTLLARRLHAAECLKRHLRVEWLRKLSTLEMLPLSHDIRHFSDNRKKRDGIT